MAVRPGVSYLRTTRGAYPVLYDAAETFPVGGSKVLRSSQRDVVTLIGAGVTLHACPAAADRLAADDIHARVIDLYSVKPIDTETLVAAAAVTNGRLIVAEDHHPEGGLGSAVADALLEAGPQKLWMTHLAVREMPGSGTSDELLSAAGIDAPTSSRPPATCSTPPDRCHPTGRRPRGRGVMGRWAAGTG